MNQGLRLELRQSQQLVMTPQLQMAIRLLQMSNLDLVAHVEAAVETNPLLVHVGEGGEAPTPKPAPDVAPGDDPAQSEAVFDTGHENLYEAAPAPALPRQGGGEEMPDIGERAGPRQTLREALHEQLGQMRAERTALVVARCIVDALEPDGYLREPLGQLAARLGIGEALAGEGLGLVQSCAPSGVGARDLAECLALQLAEKGRLDPMMRRFLESLELLARGDRKKLKAVTGADDEDIADMLAEIRRLDPRPGAAFADEPVEVRVPDVLVREVPGGGWEIELNPETLPRVALDRHYAARLDGAGEVVDRWLAERRAEAAWLIRSVDKRAGTIVSVSAEIVRRQERFLREGAGGLRPLTLKQVAEATGLHESTVSRVTANKHMATPRGIFELKFFFTNSVGGDADLSAETVRQRIRAMVEAEPADGILSDDTLVEKLQAEGIDIARRTVAKYRKALMIPSSVERRRLKGLG